MTSLTIKSPVVVPAKLVPYSIRDLKFNILTRHSGETCPVLDMGAGIQGW